MDLFTVLIVVVLAALVFGLFKPLDPETGRVVTFVLVILLIIWIVHGYPWHAPVIPPCR